jgi:hypothetical protein
VLRANLRTGESVDYALLKPRRAYLVPASGTVDVNGIRLHARDGAAIEEVSRLCITAIEAAEIVMVDVSFKS